MAARTLISLARHADVCASPWVWTMSKHAWVLVRIYVCMCSYGNSSNECALPQCNLLVASAAHEAQSLTQQWRRRSRLVCSFCKICAKSRTNLCIQHNANTHACMQALTQTHVHTYTQLQMESQMRWNSLQKLFSLSNSTKRNSVKTSVQTSAQVRWDWRALGIK